MYVEFAIPNTEFAGSTLLLIRYYIVKWAEQYGISYTEKTIKHTHRVCFDRDEYYSLFSLTFVPSSELVQFRIIVDLNNKI